MITIKLNIENDKIIFFCENKIHSNQSDLDRTGIGINNTKQRLRSLYPKLHILKIINENEIFTVQLIVNC